MSDALYLLQPVGKIIKSTVDGETTYYQKTAAATWVELDTGVTLSQNDPRMRVVLRRAEEVKGIELKNLSANKSLAYHFMSGGILKPKALAGSVMGGVSPDHHSSASRLIMHLDTETTIQHKDARKILSMGIMAENGDLPGMPGKKQVEALFLQNLVDARSLSSEQFTVHDPLGLNRPGLVDSNKTASIHNLLHVNKQAANSIDRLLSDRNARAKAEAAGVNIKTLRQLVNDVNAQSKRPESAISAVQALRPLANARAEVDKVADLGLMGGKKGFLFGMNDFVIVGSQTSAKQYAQSVIDAPVAGGGPRPIAFTFNLDFEEQNLELSKYHNVDIRDLRGGVALSMQSMFPSSGLSLSSHIGYMYPDMIKRMGVSRIAAKEIFQEFNKGFGSKYFKGMNVDNLDDMLKRVLGEKRTSREQHYGLSDAQMQAGIRQNMTRILDTLDKEQRGIFTTEGLNIKHRMLIELVGETIAQQKAKSAPALQAAKIYKQAKNDFFNRIPYNKIEKNIQHRIEIAASKNLDRSLAGSLEGVLGGGGTIGSILAGAALGGTVRWAASKLRQRVSRDDTRLEGLSHNSWQTIANRYMLTDFGSPRRDLGVSDIIRGAGHFMKSWYNEEIKKGDKSLIGIYNQLKHEAANDKNILSKIDRGIARAVGPTANKILVKGFKMRPTRSLDFFMNAYDHGLVKSLAKGSIIGARNAYTMAGGAPGIARLALQKLGGIFFQPNGGLTGVATLATIGVASGLLLNALKGKADPKMKRHELVKDNVRDDPRLKDLKRKRTLKNLADTRNAKMDGMPFAQSQARKQNRLGLTDFGSTQRERGSMGQLVGRVGPMPLRNEQARQQLNEVQVASDMQIGGTSVEKEISRATRNMDRPTLAQAERNVAGDQHFMGARRADTPMAEPDEILTGGNESGVNKRAASTETVVNARMEGEASRRAEEDAGYKQAVADNRAHEARRLNTKYYDTTQGFGRYEKNIAQVSHRKSYLNKDRVLDITSPKPRSKATELPRSRIPSMLKGMPPIDRPNEKITVKEGTRLTSPQENLNARRYSNNIAAKPISIGLSLNTSVTAVKNADDLYSANAFSTSTRPTDIILDHMFMEPPRRSPIEPEDTHLSIDIIQKSSVTEKPLPSAITDGDYIPSVTRRNLQPRQQPIRRVSRAAENPTQREYRGRSMRNNPVPNALSARMVYHNQASTRAHLGYTGGGANNMFQTTPMTL